MLNKGQIEWGDGKSTPFMVQGIVQEANGWGIIFVQDISHDLDQPL